MVLVVAAFAMTVLEIARLVANHLGVGLLPIDTVAIILAFVVLYLERGGRTRAISCVSN